MSHVRLFYTRYQSGFHLLARVLIITAVLLSLRAAAAYAGNDITFDELNDLMGNWTKGSLGKALALIEYDPEAWDNLGIVHMRQNDFPKALEYFGKAVGLDKSYALGYSNMAFVYFQIYGSDKKTETLTRAIDNFRKATAADPAMNLAWKGLGVVSLEAGKPEEAIASWEKAIAADPKDDYSTFSLGLEYLKKADKTRALAMFQKYLELRGPRLSPDDRAKVQALIDRCK